MVFHIGNRGPEDTFEVFAKHCVALRYPNNPILIYKSSYDEHTWHLMIMGQKKRMEGQPQYLMDNTEEGQAILHGTFMSDLTQSFLMSQEVDTLVEIAKKRGIKTTLRDRLALTLKILSDQAEKKVVA